MKDKEKVRKRNLEIIKTITFKIADDEVGSGIFCMNKDEDSLKGCKNLAKQIKRGWKFYVSPVFDFFLFRLYSYSYFYQGVLEGQIRQEIDLKNGLFSFKDLWFVTDEHGLFKELEDEFFKNNDLIKRSDNLKPTPFQKYTLGKFKGEVDEQIQEEER